MMQHAKRISNNIPRNIPLIKKIVMFIGDDFVKESYFSDSCDGGIFVIMISDLKSRDK